MILVILNDSHDSHYSWVILELFLNDYPGDSHDSWVILMVLMILKWFSNSSPSSHVLWFSNDSQVILKQILKQFSWFLSDSHDSQGNSYDSQAILVILERYMNNSQGDFWMILVILKWLSNDSQGDSQVILDWFLSNSHYYWMIFEWLSYNSQAILVILKWFWNNSWLILKLILEWFV